MNKDQLLIIKEKALRNLKMATENNNKSRIENYKDQLKRIDEELNKLESNAIDEFLNNWESNAIEYYMSVILKGLEIQKKHKSDTEHLSAWDSTQIWKETVKAYWNDHSKAYDLYVKYWNGNIEVLKNGIADEVCKEKESKRKSLINRVEKKIGSIIDARSLKIGHNGDLNGIIIGELGSVKIETIFAGGHNIQKLHYRVLIKK